MCALSITRPGRWEWPFAGTRIIGRSAARRGLDESDCLRPEKEQLEKYAEAFYGLARLFQELPCQKERLGDVDMEKLFREIKMQACADCPRAEDCWGEGYFDSCRFFYELSERLGNGDSLDEETAKRLEERCAKPGLLAETVQGVCGQARMDLMWSNRMMEQRTAAGEQIFQTAELLRHTADGFSAVPKMEERIRKKLRREIRYLDIELRNIRIFLRDGTRTEIYLLLRSDKRVCVSAKTIAEVLSECCGEKMRPAWNCRAAVSSEPAYFHFVPDTKYQIFCGISRITKAGEMVSGDNYAFLQKDTGKVVMSLADGMGSGVRACQESEKVIELLEQFLDAGFPQETAVRMINSCILLQNWRQIFSTLDLCMVDLYSAGCDLIKSGAAATFLYQGNEIEVIPSHAFPMGVMQQADYESMHRQLRPGSSIIMMTDGVLDALPQEGRERLMAELIGRAAARNAKEYARRLMEKVYLMQKLQARDDMTILVGTIWDK